MTRGPLEEMLSRETQKCPPESPRVSPGTQSRASRAGLLLPLEFRVVNLMLIERVSEAGLSRTNRPGLGHS